MLVYAVCTSTPVPGSHIYMDGWHNTRKETSEQQAPSTRLAQTQSVRCDLAQSN